MNKAEEIKKAFLEMENAETLCDRAEELYTFKPDEKHEKEFDEAYKTSFNATEKLISLLCGIGYDAKTWRKVLATKRDSVKDLVKRLSA